MIEVPGSRFGRLVLVGKAANSKWVCRCDCGADTTAATSDLRRGKVRSCGCLKREMMHAKAIARNTLHGAASKASKTTEYRSWQSMRTRCTNPNFDGYEYYGGRGVTVCERWDSFEAFLSDMGAKPTPKHSIDRINPNGNYEPSNCRWATQIEQRNNRRDSQPKEANHDHA